MRTLRWKKLLVVNKKLMRHEIKKLESVINPDTEEVRARYSIAHQSVKAFVVEKTHPIVEEKVLA